MKKVFEFYHVGASVNSGIDPPFRAVSSSPIKRSPGKADLIASIIITSLALSMNKLLKKNLNQKY